MSISRDCQSINWSRNVTLAITLIFLFIAQNAGEQNQLNNNSEVVLVRRHQRHSKRLERFFVENFIKKVNRCQMGITNKEYLLRLNYIIL